MAANPNALVAQEQQLTGNERQDSDARLLEEIKKLLPGQVNQQQQAAPAAGPLKIRLPLADGTLKEYEFENTEQLSAGLAQTFNNFRQTLAELQANQPPPPQEKPVEKTEFSKEEFLRIAGDDPRAGINYVLQHGLFRGQADDAFGALSKTVQDVQDMKERMAVFQFREAHPEINGNQQIGPILDKIRQELGIARENPAAWEASLAVARERGIVPSLAQIQAYQAQQQQQQRFTQGVPSPLGRSSIGGGFNPDEVSPELMQAAEQLDADKLEAFLRQKGLFS